MIRVSSSIFAILHEVVLAKDLKERIPSPNEGEGAEETAQQAVLNGQAHPEEPFGFAQGKLHDEGSLVMKNDRQSGFILISAMIVMVVLATAIVGLLVRTFTATRSISFKEQDTQAFWIAEAGMQFAGWRARYQNPKVNFSTKNVLLNGSYDVTATFVSPTYTVVSTGTVTLGADTLTRTIGQRWTSGGKVANSWSEL